MILGAEIVGRISEGSEFAIAWLPPAPHGPVSIGSWGEGVAQGFKPPCTEDPVKKKQLVMIEKPRHITPLLLNCIIVSSNVLTKFLSKEFFCKGGNEKMKKRRCKKILLQH